MIVDQDGMVRFADQVVSSQLRRDPHNLIGQPLGIPLFTGDVIEIEIIRKNEEPGMAEMRMDETQWEGKTAYFLSLGDITDRKQVEESLRELDRKKSELPNLIVLDVAMASMDGFEVLRRSKLDPDLEEISVAMLTAMSAAKGESLGMELIVHHYVSKP